MPVFHRARSLAHAAGPRNDLPTQFLKRLPASLRGLVRRAIVGAILVPPTFGKGIPMAQKVHIVLEDDLDGSEATETVSFALDGTSYEIDLNDDNAAKLRDALAVYVGHARKVSGGARRSGGGGGGGGRRG